jgi:mannose-6-phosphate isomerase-like protein (cupin superfamily)
VLEGELEMTIGNKTAIVGPYSFAYAPPNATHAFKPYGGKPCRVLHWNSPGVTNGSPRRSSGSGTSGPSAARSGAR